jgi:ABC-type Fe3+/spermidine/putrescine transport system ATPase subunit
MVFQNYALWPHMTVADNICYGLRLRKLPAASVQARLQEGLRKVNLIGFEARYPGQLSGGQQQRVALARALVLNPDILLLDEPLSNLDAKIRIQVRAEIRRLQQELRITTIYVTHDQEEALSISDRVAVMYAGRVEQVGTPTEMYEAPASVGVADFLGKANFLEAQVVCRQDERIRVRLASGATLDVDRGDATWDPMEGEPATLFIRPERVRVGDEPGRLAVRLPATVARLTFLGGIVRYSLDVGEERPVLADGQRLLPGLEPGTPATVHFDLADLRAYPGNQRPWGESP